MTVWGALRRLAGWMVEAGPDRDPARRHALSTYLFGRLLGLVFLIAFVSFHVQYEGLIGELGIQPALHRLAWYARQGMGYWDAPTLGWAFGADDRGLATMCVLGELAALGLLVGVTPGPCALLSSALYLSLVTLGGPFMAFQWDTLLVEVGVAASLALPWATRLHCPRRLVSPPPLGRWLLYLLAFRLMFLSGLVKLRSGDPTWRNLEALSVHYWTQPLPNPVSYYVHQLPDGFHSLSTAAAVLVELVVPFAIFFGRRGRRLAFGGLAGLMALIALTGNYGFFNLLAFTLLVPLLDDAALLRITPERARAWFAEPEGDLARPRVWGRHAAALLSGAIVVLGVLRLGVGVGLAPVMPEALLDASNAGARFAVVNGYGLFARMTTERREIRIEGSMDGREWRPYRFAHKPSDPNELPGISAPHMPRLDWQMWFAALGRYEDSPWLAAMMRRLLEGRGEVQELFEEVPFEGRPPVHIRARVAPYRFRDRTHPAPDGAVWVVGEWAPYSPTLTRR